MSGRCPDNFWIENGIIGNMNKLGIIVWDDEIFCHGSEVYVGGKPYDSLGEFISRYNCGGGFWWDSREGFWKSSNGTHARPAKQGYEIMVEVDKDRGFAGKISKRAKPKSSQGPSGSRKTF